MLKRAATLVLVIAGATAGSAHAASVQTITVINRAHVRPAALRRVERAVRFQATVLHAYWGTPLIRFGRGGWTFTVQVNPDGPGVGGAHGFAQDPHGQPVYVCLGRPATSCFLGEEGTFTPNAWISTSGQPWQDWSAKFSHEMLEMLVDPYGNTRSVTDDLAEVCDPVNGRTYSLLGVPVSDFMLPTWLYGGPGPYDALGVMRHR